MEMLHGWDIVQILSSCKGHLVFQTTGHVVRASGLPGKWLGFETGMCCTQQWMTNTDWHPCFLPFFDPFGLKQLFVESHVSSCLRTGAERRFEAENVYKEYTCLCLMRKSISGIQVSACTTRLEWNLKLQQDVNIHFLRHIKMKR